MNSGMALVVDQRGAALELGNHDTLVLRYDDGRTERVGIRALGCVVLNGDIDLSTGVLRALAAHGVALVGIPVRGRTPAVSFTRLPNRLTMLRHAQHLAYADRELRMRLARMVVLHKLKSMGDAVSAHATGWDDGNAVDAAMQAADVPSLMGVEGASTARYFDFLRRRVRDPFAFSGRSRRPPEDPMNALMSLTSCLAQAAAVQLALRAGLDVQVGFLHGIFRDRESLALDLLEPARAAMDSWLAQLLCDRKSLTPEMFSINAGEGCRLTKAGRATFYPLWFAEGHPVAMRPMRRAMAAVLEVLRREARAHQARKESSLAPENGRGDWMNTDIGERMA